MSCPVTSSEIRQLISRLEQLEVWQREVESTASSSAGGYTRGDPRARAKAARPIVPKAKFPAIPQIARNFELVKAAGPDFIGKPFPGVEEGPGPIPKLVEDQASFVCADLREAIQRVHLCYSAGHWARSSLETYTEPLNAPILSSPAVHYIVLRACGLGDFVRFASADHFEKFKRQASSDVSLYFGFETETELEVFCQGARIAVPALWGPC